MKLQENAQQKVQQLSAPIYRLKRQAKALAKTRGLALHAALDQLARQEGFRSWSHLAAEVAQTSPARALLNSLQPGELILLGARPGQGKTLLGLELLALAAAAGRAAVFFTLEYTPEQTLERLRSIGQAASADAGNIKLDCSDQICADYIIDQQRDADEGSVLVIDYLQLLDQNRSHPPLAEQLAALQRFAESRAIVIVFISQIDRAFEARAGSMPGIEDIRLPNPIDVDMFSKQCFIHDGEVLIHAAGG